MWSARLAADNSACEADINPLIIFIIRQHPTLMHDAHFFLASLMKENLQHYLLLWQLELAACCKIFIQVFVCVCVHHIIGNLQISSYMQPQSADTKTVAT